MLTLKTEPRKITGRKTDQLRKGGIIPAVVYGRDLKSKMIQVKVQAFEEVYQEAGTSSLINLEIDQEKPLKVLIYALQYHYLTDQVQHIDFYKIKAGEKITVPVTLNFIGEAPVVKELGGHLITNLDRVEIECLPEDLINEIEVDVSSLKKLDDTIRIKDLKFSDQIKILQDSEAPVIHAEEPRRAEEEEAAEAEEGKPEEVERVGEAEKEAEEGKSEEKKEEKGKGKAKEGKPTS
ncbi:50S ribosomal protein L25 [Patescibacteria group bacterium]|nr:50S ribosomal protein L25 [Patescibacteria group bacterium]